MKISENSTDGANNSLSSVREPHGVINELGQHGKRRGKLDVNKWLIDHLPSMGPVDKRLFFRTLDSNRPFEKLHPIRPFNMGPTIEKTLSLPSLEKLPPMKSVSDKWLPTRPAFDNLPPLRPAFDNLPPMTSIDMWPDVDRIKMDIKMFDFKPYQPTPAAAPHVPASSVLETLSALGAIALLMTVVGVIIAHARRTRRGRVVRSGARAVQRGALTSTALPNDPRRPSGPGERRLLINDMPPSYDECALSSNNQFVSEDPPPYTYYNDTEPLVHTRRQNTLYENRLKAEAVAKITTSNDSEHVAAEMKMGLVFDNGRIVERLSLDVTCNNKDARVTVNNNVDQQSTEHADKHRVMYVDDTDKVKVNTQ